MTNTTATNNSDDAEQKVDDTRPAVPLGFAVATAPVDTSATPAAALGTGTATATPALGTAVATPTVATAAATPAVATATATATATPAVATAAATPAVATAALQENVQAETIDPDEEEEEDLVFDPNAIAQELLQDDQDGLHLQRNQTYEREKASLIGTTVYGASCFGGCRLTWKVRDDVQPEETAEDIEYDKVGIKGFDFNDAKNR